VLLNKGGGGFWFIFGSVDGTLHGVLGSGDDSSKC
jgi:hypothetical protein